MKVCLNVIISVCMYVYVYTCKYVNSASQEESSRLLEGVPYVTVYRYNPKYLYPNLNITEIMARKRGLFRFKIMNPAPPILCATAFMTLRLECTANRACVTVSCLYGSWKRHVNSWRPMNDHGVNASVYYFNLMALCHS